MEREFAAVAMELMLLVFRMKLLLLTMIRLLETTSKPMSNFSPGHQDRQVV
jgi:hypothetical protein